MSIQQVPEWKRLYDQRIEQQLAYLVMLEDRHRGWAQDEDDREIAQAHSDISVALAEIIQQYTGLQKAITKKRANIH